jgi:hypothetical protein
MTPGGSPRARRLLVLGALIVVGVAAVIATSSWMAWRAGADYRVLIRGATATELEQVVEALQAFANAGLQLPPTEVSVHPPDRCPIGGPVSGQAFEGRPRHRVVMCTTETRVVVHELAHAWTFEYMGPRERRAFALMRELPTWHERTHAWEERAMEHAAEVITWAVLHLDPDELKVTPRDPESLRLAYGFILGLAADSQPHGTLRGMYRPRGTVVRLSPDPCRAVSRIDARIADRFQHHQASTLDADAGVCWVPVSGAMQPVAVVEVPPAG